MKTVTCPKCNQVIAVPNGKDFVICCDNVIFTFVINDNDIDSFIDELINPSKPNQALNDVTIKYKKIK